MYKKLYLLLSFGSAVLIGNMDVLDQVLEFANCCAYLNEKTWFDKNTVWSASLKNLSVEKNFTDHLDGFFTRFFSRKPAPALYRPARFSFSRLQNFCRKNTFGKLIFKCSPL